MKLLSRNSAGLVLGCVLVLATPGVKADPNDAEYNRLRNNESMRDQAYYDRINSPSSNSSSGSSSSPGFGAPYEWKPHNGTVVATYVFKTWVRETPTQVVSRLRREAAAGNMQSQFDLGRVLFGGYQDVPVDLPAARQLFIDAAKQGHPPAMTQAGAMLYWGQGGPVDKDAATAWVKQSAEQGDSYGQALYGLWSLVAARAQSNDAPAPEALSMLRKAASHGEMLAQRALFAVYFYGANGATQDLSRAFTYAKMAAVQGDAQSMSDVATCMMMGYGVEKNEAGAVQYLKRSAELGNTGAQVNYSVMLTQGRLVPRDLAAGAKFSRLAADKGDVNGQVLLAKSYYFGEGVDKNLTESARWFRKAAAQGSKEAADALAEPAMVEAAGRL